MSATDPQGTHANIVRVAIHPAIGIARIGNSPDGFFIGPETLGTSPPIPGGPRDAQGRIKRQAARFRVYGYDAAGNVVQELTAADADIAWTVQVANKKSSWFNFNVAMDIPEAQDVGLRNAGFSPANRHHIEITPAPRSIQGREASGPQYQFDDGRFVGKPVSLGELRTDDEGRLLFLGGHGVSASYDGSPVTTFANNDKWHDDTSDGTVHARVVLHQTGRTLIADSAWVVTAPPNYGPPLDGVLTMQDVLDDLLFVPGGPLPGPVSFKDHVWPLLRRMRDTQWANKGFAVQFGIGGTSALMDPALLPRLADPSPTYFEFRNQVLHLFRASDYSEMSPIGLPPFYGDAMALKPDSPRQWLALTPLQAARMEAWVKGDFLADMSAEELMAPGGPDDTAPELASLPLQDRPTTLDRAAMEASLGGAFHPGCEMTWPMRHAILYRSYFRIKEYHGPPRSFGTVLTPQQAVAVGGPLDGSTPGDITRWMAVPWQTDTASCRSGYDAAYDEFLPTFWAARVPNQVMDPEMFEAVKQAAASGASPQELERLFLERGDWTAPLGADYRTAIQNMIHQFSDLGILQTHHVDLGPSLPSTFHVADRSTDPPAEVQAPAHHIQTADIVKVNARLRDLESSPRDDPTPVDLVHVDMQEKPASAEEAPHHAKATKPSKASKR